MDSSLRLPQQTLSAFVACYLACWAFDGAQSVSATHGLGSITTTVVMALVPILTLTFVITMPALLKTSSICHRQELQTQIPATHQQGANGQKDAASEESKDEFHKENQAHENQPSIAGYFTQVAKHATGQLKPDITSLFAGIDGYVSTKVKPAEDEDVEVEAEMASDTTEDTLVDVEVPGVQAYHHDSAETTRKRKRNKKSKVINAPSFFNSY